MDIDELRVAKGSISDRVYAGILDEEKELWKEKKDITNDFIQAVIDVFGGYKTVITDSETGKSYKIKVVEVDNEDEK
jgi:hypothetical protein